MFRILSIDGGGIRGIIPGRILVELEKVAGKPVADLFDLVAGTSTGGILAATLLAPGPGGRPRYTARQALDLYLENGDEIFSVSTWKRITSALGTLDEKYSADALEGILRRYFGDEKLGGLLRPSLITAYDIKRRRAHFFTSHDARTNPSLDFHLKDVCRATSAAPTYFEPAILQGVQGPSQFPLIDGGVFANNPAMCAYAEAVAKKDVPGFEKMKDGVVMVSLGTGFMRQKPIRASEASGWGLAGWVRPLIDILMSGVAETVDYQMRQILPPDRYIRVNVEIDYADEEMDNATQRNMNDLQSEAEDWIRANGDAMKKMAAMVG